MTMATRHKAASLTDRSILATKGERSVGAYARRQRRRQVAVALAGVGLIVVAVIVYELFPQTVRNAPRTYPVMVRCAACGFEGALYVPFDQAFPANCPKCGQPGCRPLWKCDDCGNRFIPDQTAPPVVCPRCKSQRVGAVPPPK